MKHVRMKSSREEFEHFVASINARDFSHELFLFTVHYCQMVEDLDWPYTKDLMHHLAQLQMLLKVIGDEEERVELDSMLAKYDSALKRKSKKKGE